MLAAWVMIASLLFVAGARLVAHDGTWLLVLANAYTAWSYLPAYFIAAFAGTTRQWPLMAVAVLVAVAHIAWIAPDFAGRDPLPAGAASAPRLRVVTANLRERNEDVSQIFAELKGLSPDILFLSEYTPAAEATAEAMGLFDAYPYRVRDVRTTARGTAIFSRYPLEAGETWDVAGVPMTRATALIGERRVRLYTVHPVSPTTVTDTHRWNDEHEALLAALAKEQGDLIVAGDFNMTTQNRWFNNYEDLGLREQHRACGEGRATTWPNGRRLYPPIRIDHIFASSSFACLRIDEGRGAGSDHRPIVEDLAILP